MKKSFASASSPSMGSFPSPGPQNSRNQKGWSSERVTKATRSGIRRHASVAGLTTPFSSGRTMPSKWDEAERWINYSPVSSAYYADSTSSYSQLLRRPKSISGPIAPLGIGYYSNYYSPKTIPLRQGLVLKKSIMVGRSPFSTGVLAPHAVSLLLFDPHDDTVSAPPYDMENEIQYSSHVLSESGEAPSPMAKLEMLQCAPSSPISQDEKHDTTTNEDRVISVFSKRDQGTQMSSPESASDADSSPKSSANSALDQQNCHSPKSEVRDVQVDSQTSVISTSRSHAAELTKEDSLHIKDSRDSSTEIQASCWDIAESTSDTSKLQREEAKIIAWENLQNANAEAAIRKLEMKLEKKRSSSMDKILNKLRKGQMKAEKMRSLKPEQQDHQVSKTCKVFSFPKYAQIWSLGSCFTTHDP